MTADFNDGDSGEILPLVVHVGQVDLEIEHKTVLDGKPVVFVNNDFDEGKTDATGKPIPDNADVSPVKADGTGLELSDMLDLSAHILPEDDEFLKGAVVSLKQISGSGTARILATRPGGTGTDDSKLVLGGNLLTDFFLSTGKFRSFNFRVEGFAAGEVTLELKFSKDGMVITDMVEIVILEPVNITFRTFIPFNNVPGPPQSFCLFGNTPRRTFELADDRSFSLLGGTHRTQQFVSVLVAGSGENPLLARLNSIGESRSYDSDALADGKIDANDDDGILNDCKLLNERATASTSGMNIDVRRLGPDRVEIHLHGGASNPLINLAPAIDWDLTLVLDTSGGAPGTYQLTGKHDGFPAYEIYIHNTQIYGFLPFSVLQVALLFPPLNVDVGTVTGSIP